MSRQVYLLGVGLTVVALALAFTDWALSLRPGVTEANVKHIREGMTHQEVKAILGEPAGRIPHEVYWFGNSAVVAIGFIEGRVIYVCSFPHDHEIARTLREWYPQTTPDPLARLRAWLGW